MELHQTIHRKRLQRIQQKQYSRAVFQIAIFISLGLVSLLFYTYPKFEITIKEIPKVQSPKFEPIKPLSIRCPLENEAPYDTTTICILPTYTSKPILIKRVVPEYPAEARMAAVEGVVIVSVLVNESGIVEEVKIRKSIPLLDKAAIEAAEQFQFKPAKLNDQAIKTWVAIPFRFKLDR